MLDVLKMDGEAYFDRTEAALKVVPRPSRWMHDNRDHFWAELPQELRDEAGRLTERLLALAGYIADAVGKAPLASEADQRDVMTGTKAMRAAFFLREFRSWTTEVLHDEGTVLGFSRRDSPTMTQAHPRLPDAASPIGQRKSAAFWT
jgi:hypothetical protein